MQCRAACLLASLVIGCGGQPHPLIDPPAIVEPPQTAQPDLLNLGTPVRDDLLGLVPNDEGATILLGHRPNDFSGSTTAFYEEGRLSLVTLDGLNRQAWHREFDFYARFFGWGGQAIALGRSDRLLWLAGQPARDFDPGLGIVERPDGYVLALDLQGVPLWQEVRSFWRDRPMRGLSGAGDRIGIHTHAHEADIYEMKFDVLTETGKQAWARNVTDDAEITGRPDFYDHVLSPQGELVAAGDTVGEAQIDGMQLRTPGVHRNPVAVMFGHDGRARWVAKPLLVGGKPVGSFSQVEVRADGSFVLLSIFDDVGTLRFGDEIVDVDGGGAVVSIVSPGGDFIWSRAIPNIRAVHAAGNSIYLVEHTYERFGEPEQACRRTRLLRLNNDGATTPVFVPQDVSCVEKPDWRADIEVQPLESGKLAVAGQFQGEVRYRNLVVSNEGRPDEDIYYAVIEPPGEADPPPGRP